MTLLVVPARSGRVRRTGRAVLIATLLVAGACVMPAGPAHAHDVLLSTTRAAATTASAAAATPSPSGSGATPVFHTAKKPGSDTSWAKVLTGAALGLAVGVGYVVHQRRRRKNASGRATT